MLCHCFLCNHYWKALCVSSLLQILPRVCRKTLQISSNTTKLKHNHTASRYRACLSLFACVFVYTLIHKHRKKKRSVSMSLTMSKGMFLVLVEAVVLIQGTTTSCVRALSLCFFFLSLCVVFSGNLFSHMLFRILCCLFV